MVMKRMAGERGKEMKNQGIKSLTISASVKRFKQLQSSFQCPKLQLLMAG
jgi:hypothetical protein